MSASIAGEVEGGTALLRKTMPPVVQRVVRSIVELDKTMEFPGGRIRKLRRSIETPGYAHELTFSCYRRLPLLSRDRTRRWFIDALDSTRRKHKLDLWAYVIMPEHVHLLFYPHSDDYYIRRILQSIKQPVARRAIDYLKANHHNWLPRLHDRADGGYHFWQPGGGYDRNIAAAAAAATAWNVVRYIHENPVRRGLAENALDRPWSSARWYDGDEQPVLAMDSAPPSA